LRIDQETFRDVKASYLGAALRMRASKLTERFAALPFELYAPVRRQLHTLWRAVNRTRGAAGLELLRRIASDSMTLPTDLHQFLTRLALLFVRLEVAFSRV
jgi:hypothetical protein